MDKTPKHLPLAVILFFLLPAMIFHTPNMLVGSTDYLNNDPLMPNMPVELNFAYPDQVDAGSSFIFSIQIKKESGYDTPGNIHCRFSGGMLPMESGFSHAEFSINNQEVNISWDSLGSSNIFEFPLKVSTQKGQEGVYPLRIEYYDNAGLMLKRNVGIYIYNSDEATFQTFTGPDTENPYRVKLIFPDEISFDETYPLDIVITKGKNTGGAKVYVQLPPASLVKVPNYHEHNYKQEQGNLCILLNSMPASPEFTIACKVTNTTNVKSVYPLNATVEFTSQSIINYDDFIAVTNLKSENTYTQNRSALNNKNAAVNADSTKVFNAMDTLLKTWKKSTGQFKQLRKQKVQVSGDEEQSPLKREVVFYSIQIVASEVVMNTIESKLRSKGIEERILEDYDGNIYRYTVGDFETLMEAKKMKEELVNKGYPDAFIVEYVNGVRGRSFY